MSAVKRLYNAVTTAPDGAGWAVLCDGKPLATPARNTLRVPTTRFAEAIAAEWRAQSASPNPDSLPLTRLAAIAIDRVPEQRAALIDDMVRYGETDLLCYRAEETEIALQQMHHFEPILEWAYETYGLVFEITDQPLPLAQPARSLAALHEALSTANDWELAALAMATPILGSVLLTLAVWDGRVDAEAAIAAATIDETYQAAKYGEDPVVVASWNARKRDLAACEFLFNSID